MVIFYLTKLFCKEALSDGFSLRSRAKIPTDKDDDILHENPGVSINLYLWDSDVK